MSPYTLVGVVFLAFVFMLLVFLAFWRYLRYRETIALAKEGLIKPDEPDENEHVAGALVFLAVGLALLVGLYPIGRSVAQGQFAWGLGPWLMPGFLFTFLGLALLAYHLVVRTNEADDGSAGEPRDEPHGGPAGGLAGEPGHDRLGGLAGEPGDEHAAETEEERRDARQ